MEIEVINLETGRSLASFINLATSSTIYNVKEEVHKIYKHLYPERQALRLGPDGKSLADDLLVISLSLKDGKLLYWQDLGWQIGWRTVFLAEYTGPLILYGVTYLRPSFLYGPHLLAPRSPLVHTAMACWSGHYIKRILETLFVHRFSHSTMPLLNIFKNCGYYWTFGAIIGYFINSPTATASAFGEAQILLGLLGFLLSEAGNLSIHLALRNLRPKGLKVVRQPLPTSNPFTWLFRYVTCPNYTYEVLSWTFFTFMTQSLPCAIFTAVGFCQMAIWAKKRKKLYMKMFPDFPPKHRAILPFLL